MANRTLGQMVLGAFGENLERKFPQHIAKRLKDVDDDNGIVGVLHDLYCAIPAEAGIAFDFAAQFVKHRGPVGLLLGEFLESIPAVSDDLRLMKNKTPEGARADLIKHYENWKKEHKMSNPIKAVFEEKPDDKTVVEEKKAEKQEVAKARVDWAKAVTKNFKNETHRKVVIAIADLCYTDGLPGNDYVTELDGSAHYALKAWYDATINISEEVAKGFATDDVNVKTLVRLATARALDLKNPANNQELMAVRQQLFHDNFDAIRLALLNHLSNHPENAVEAGIKDALDGMSKLAGFLPGGKGTAVKTLLNYGKNVASLAIATIGFVVLYVLLLFVAAWADTEQVQWLRLFSYGSVLVLLGLPVIGMLFGWMFPESSEDKEFPAKGLAVQSFSLLFGGMVSPILIGAAFTVDAILPVVPRWDAMVFGPLAVVAWALISAGLLQKVVNEIVSLEALVASAFSQETAKQLREKLEKTYWFAKVADTIAYAVILVWVVAVPLAWLKVSQETRLGVIGMVSLFGLLSVFLARMVFHTHGAQNPTADLIKTNHIGDSKLVSTLQRRWVPLALIVLALFVVVPTLEFVKTNHLSENMTAIGTHVTETGVNWAAEKTGTVLPAQTNGGNAASGATVTSGTGTATAPVTGKAHKSKHDKMCDAMGGAAMCAEHGQDFGPCPCN